MVKVLLVDDEPFILREMDKLLSGLPDVVVCKTLRNGLDARDYLLANGDVDVVFADIRMPKMDGLQLAEWVKENRPRLPVVIVSAYRDFELAKRAVSCGAREYICKPLRAEEALKLLDEIARDQIREMKERLYTQNRIEDAYVNVRYQEILGGLENPTQWHYSLYRMNYKSEDNLKMGVTEQMLSAALCNILRSQNLEILVMRDFQFNGRIQFRVLAKSSGLLPTLEAVNRDVKQLTGLPLRFKKGRNGSVPELLENDAVIHQAKDYVMENLGKDFSRDDVANAVHLSSSYFSKFFQEKTGMTFARYVRDTRLHRCSQLLKQDYKVADAAFHSGFRNMNHFYEIFKAEMGCSPTEFRQTGILDDGDD